MVCAGGGRAGVRGARAGRKGDQGWQIVRLEGVARLRGTLACREGPPRGAQRWVRAWERWGWHQEWVTSGQQRAGEGVAIEGDAWDQAPPRRRQARAAHRKQRGEGEGHPYAFSEWGLIRQCNGRCAVSGGTAAWCVGGPRARSHSGATVFSCAGCPLEATKKGWGSMLCPAAAGRGGQHLVASTKVPPPPQSSTFVFLWELTQTS
jgi:hypothetical protein